jgi:hypothetical protein
MRVCIYAAAAGVRARGECLAKVSECKVPLGRINRRIANGVTLTQFVCVRA